MKIFLDVGAHTGETLRAVLDPRFSFDQIICFEPVPTCHKPLARFRDSRVLLNQFGLWKETCERPIYGSGSTGASIFTGSRWGTNRRETIRLVRASDWFREHIDNDDDVFMKLNVEGSECDVLDDLLDSGEIRKIRSMLVTFDVVKVAGLEHRADEVRGRLDAEGVDYMVMSRRLGVQYVARVQNFLDAVGALDPQKQRFSARLRTLRTRARWVILPALIGRLGLHRFVRPLIPRGLRNRLRSHVMGYTYEKHATSPATLASAHAPSQPGGDAKDSS